MPIYYKKVDPSAPDEVQILDSKWKFSSTPRLPTSDTLDSILCEDLNRPLISRPQLDQILAENEEMVETSCGQVVVAHEGAKLREKKPVIITFHDVGMNHSLNFEGFFDSADNRLLLESFSVIHINAPGQERNAARIPDNSYPSMSELALCVKEVAQHFSLKSFLGFGCGAGAYILSETALMFPEMVDNLVLINPSVGRASWAEWLFQKRNIRALRTNLG